MKNFQNEIELERYFLYTKAKRMINITKGTAALFLIVWVIGFIGFVMTRWELAIAYLVATGLVYGLQKRIPKATAITLGIQHAMEATCITVGLTWWITRQADELYTSMWTSLSIALAIYAVCKLPHVYCSILKLRYIDDLAAFNATHPIPRQPKK